MSGASWHKGFDRSGDMENAIGMKILEGPPQLDPEDVGPTEVGDAESSTEVMSEATSTSVGMQTASSIGTQTDEYVDDIICQTCGEAGVLHACGHWQCPTLECRPTWYQRFEARKWLVPRTPARAQNEQLFQTRERCVDCRPEGRCLKGNCPRYCNFVFRRGTCKFGAKCSFCHLHGRADATGKFRGEVDGALDLPWPPSGSHLPPPRPQWFGGPDKPQGQGPYATSDGMDRMRGCCNDGEPWKVSLSSGRVTAVVPSPNVLPDAGGIFNASPKVLLHSANGMFVQSV
ncbi:unnamed protein product [Prorocentrum cordatum]|uniref:C3H1-type domain-containing protein n=2 Tax=Prorocentrum cordatum TaxID=2364126 RepID=A0ABN9Q6U3_9DINO|nr:unnamed protein product [Polarella glacialis]